MLTNWILGTWEHFKHKNGSLFKKSGRHPSDTCVHHCPCSVVGIFPGSPVQWLSQLMGNFFSLGSRVCMELVTLLSFGTTQTCPLFLVIYPPTAVTAQVSINLGPVARLDCGEGQMQVRTCPVQWKAQLILFSEQATPWHAGGDSGEIGIELSSPLPTL
jgi:hypothetical protein